MVSGISPVPSMEKQRHSSMNLVRLRVALRLVAMVCVLFAGSATAQLMGVQFEGLEIKEIEITDDSGRVDPEFKRVLQDLVRPELGKIYSLVRIRKSLAAIYQTGKVESVSVDAIELPTGGLKITFRIKRKLVVSKVQVTIRAAEGQQITGDEIQLRVNLIRPGVEATTESINRSVDGILIYLRERGYFDAEVVSQISTRSEKGDVAIVFSVDPKSQSRVRALRIDIKGAENEKIQRKLKLRKGSLYSDDAQREDLERIKKALGEQGFFVPDLREVRLTRVDANNVDIVLEGEAGPKVQVNVVSGRVRVSEDLLEKLPIRRLGTLDYSAIVEGERRLERYFQEKGFFFADVTQKCSISIPEKDLAAEGLRNDTEQLCTRLTSLDLRGQTAAIEYSAELKIPSRLSSIRFEGIDDFRVDGTRIFQTGEVQIVTPTSRPLSASDLKPILQSREASRFGAIPYVGYGRGFTNSDVLLEDEENIRSLLVELGYRDAKVYHLLGTDISSGGLIVTFLIEAGSRTRIKSIDFKNNKEFPSEVLRSVLKDKNELDTAERPFSSAIVREWIRKITEFYSSKGFFNTRIVSRVRDEASAADDVDVELFVESEGSRIFIGDLLITGNEKVRRDAIVSGLDLRPGQLLRNSDIFSSEQRLYESDVFRLVRIEAGPTQTNANGRQVADVSINVEEQPSRLLTYGGGYSTDLGPFGSFDIRNLNFLNRLYQAGGRVKISRLQQLVQLDFLHPRFIRDGIKDDSSKRFAPLTFTLQYQRDTTVTRFFRTALDRGTFGIVQRLDENGNPIDEFGGETGSPTINRFSAVIETSRTLSTKKRSVLFARYKYEDVRLFNIESLLIRDILQPDARTRISGPGVSFVRDTRVNCRFVFSLEEIANRGDGLTRCRYNPTDPTKGDFLTADYSIAAPFLGSNIGFQKFQLSYTAYSSPRQLKGVTLAGRVLVGVSGIFSRKGRFRDSQAPELDGILPISERFFGGGSTSLRGFDFESAGPRLVLRPQGTFRDNDGRIINLEPFTIPFGGNAIAVLNLEARIPLGNSLRFVPFYDGGNVYQKVRDLFKPRPQSANPTDGNLRSRWTNTFGLGLRLKTPIGGELAVDYGYLLNPPRFTVPQETGPDGVYRLRQGQFHIRFAQAF